MDCESRNLDEITKIQLKRSYAACARTEPPLSRPNYLDRLPDELVLKIISSLPLADKELFTAISSLGLSCRRFNRLLWEKSAASTLVKRSAPVVARLFDNYHKKWTPFLVARLRRYFEHCDALMIALADKSMDSNRHPFHREMFWEEVTSVGILCIIRLDGLEDDKPDLKAIEKFPMPWLIAIHYAALTFQRAFNARVLHPRAGDGGESNLYRYGDSVGFAGAFQHMLFSHGPFIARRFLLWTQTTQDHDELNELIQLLKYAKWTERKALRDPGFALEYRPDTWAVGEIAGRMAECQRTCEDGVELAKLGFTDEGAMLLRRIVARWNQRGVPRW